MLLEVLESIVPHWMVTDPRAAFLRLMAGPAALLDGIGEVVYQARMASLPGQVRTAGVPGLGGFDSVDALFLIARDRLVTPAQVFGLPWVTEKPWDLAKRLQRWRDDWINNTGAFGLLDQLAAVLIPTVPVLRLVYRGTNGLTSWFTRELDGTRRLQRSDSNGFYYNPGTGTVGNDFTAAQAWDWDDTSIPATPDQSDESRVWIVAYVPAATPYVTTTDLTCNDVGVVDDAWDNPTAQVLGQPTAGTVGTNAPVGFVSLVQNVLIQRHTAGCKIAYLIIAFDTASFNPDGTSTAGSSASAYPDGTWGWASAPGTVSGAATRIAARLQTAEYWQVSDCSAVNFGPV